MSSAASDFFHRTIVFENLFNSVNRRGKYVFSTSGYLLSSPAMAFCYKAEIFHLNRLSRAKKPAANI
jgi:hypothetical protein